jgi:hypothetical protein
MDPEARRIVVRRIKRERGMFRKRLRTVMKKVEGLYTRCGGGEVFLAIHKNGKFYVFSSKPENKRWPPPLSDIVSPDIVFIINVWC